jgi:hypothetical protein
VARSIVVALLFVARVFLLLVFASRHAKTVRGREYEDGSHRRSRSSSPRSTRSSGSSAQSLARGERLSRARGDRRRRRLDRRHRRPRRGPRAARRTRPAPAELGQAGRAQPRDRRATPRHRRHGRRGHRLRAATLASSSSRSARRGRRRLRATRRSGTAAAARPLAAHRVRDGLQPRPPLYDVLRCMPTVPARSARSGARRSSTWAASRERRSPRTPTSRSPSARGLARGLRGERRAWTEAPATLRGLWRQRYRWCYGTLQSVWKHRAALLAPRRAAIGRRGLPYLVLFQIVLRSSRR